MKEKLTRQSHFRVLKNTAKKIPEHRNPSAPNFQHPIERAVMTCFATFYLQQPSLLSHEKKLTRKTYKANFKKLFHEKPMQCSQSIRNILDRVSPDLFTPAFDNIFKRLDRSGVLRQLKFNNKFGLLLSGDGVDYFSSQEISCSNCSTAKHKKDGNVVSTTYSHKMFNVGIVHPTENIFIPLNPEFITPQDGAKKQDCEQNAAKRWMRSFRKRHKTINVTLQVDALHCSHEFLSLVLSNRLHFVATCKPGSTPTLFEWVKTARNGGDTHVIEKKVKQKGKVVIYRFEYLNSIPIRDTQDALKVNFASLEVIDPKTNLTLQKFAYVTDHKIDDKSVELVITAGRKRWKVENEGNNTLKNQGYYFDHNYGHGKKNLSAIIATLILYSFMTHVILRIVNQDKIAYILNQSSSRRSCFELLRGIVDIVTVQSWEELYLIAMKALTVG